MHSCTDSNFIRDKDKEGSLSGYIFTVFGNDVVWKANLQYIVALSITKVEFIASTEVEFIACIEAIKERSWPRGFTR